MFQVNHHPDAVVVGSEDMGGFINGTVALNEPHQDVLPIAFIDDCKTNKQLYVVFDALLLIDTNQKRLNFIEDAVFTTDHAPSADRAEDAIRTVLLKWWLSIFNSAYGIAPYARE